MVLGFLNKKDKNEVFWDWFVKHQSDYYSDKIDESLFNNLSIQLNKVDANLTFEYNVPHFQGRI